MTILYILLAIIILMILITVHELGHFIAGKIFGFKINEFAIGFGKAIYKRTNAKGEVFSIRILPLGGFCAFEGEDEENPSPEAFNNQKPWKRIIVLLSGVLFNFMFGIFMSVVFLLANGYFLPRVSALAPDNTFALQKGDVIQKVNGKSIEIYRSLQDMTSKIAAGENITLTIKRDGSVQDVVVQRYKHQAFYYVGYESGYSLFDATGNQVSLDEFKSIVLNSPIQKDADGKIQKWVPANDYYKSSEITEDNKYTVEELTKVAGISLATEGTSLGLVLGAEHQRFGFFEALLKAWPFAFYLCGLILSALLGLFTGATKIADMGGTITAISQMADISKASFESQSISQFLLLFPLLSMNLALFNALPIPALDGFHTLFVIFEWITGKPVNRTVEGWINTIGLFVLLGLVIFLDVYHFFIACRLLL